MYMGNFLSKYREDLGNCFGGLVGVANIKGREVRYIYMLNG